MRREDHLRFCKTCVNREMDFKVGIICKLTGKVADFEAECPSFKLDEEEVKRLDDNQAMERHQIAGRLSKENLEKLKSEQSLPAAIFAGIFIGVMAAVTWAAITVATEMQIGLVAIAIGFAVGFGMRFFGKGIDPIFGICGAIIAILSCVLGNFLSIIGFVAISEDLSYLQTFMYFDYSLTFEVMKETASPMDLIFYAIAAGQGYKFSFREITEKELYEIQNEKL